MSISGLIIIAIVIVLVIILWSLLAVRGSGYNASKEGLFLTNEDVPNRDINSKPNDVQYDNVDAEVERQHTVLDDDDLGFINSAIYGCICDDVPHEDTIPNNVQYDHNIEAKVEKQHPILDHNSAVFQINIRYLKGKGSPLIIDSSTGALLLPDRAGSSVITMVPGTHFQVGCPGSKIKIDENTTIVGKVDAVALSGSLVSISGRTADLYKIKCSKRIASVARPTGSSCFGNLGEEIEIGFLFPDGHFIRVMTTCFDPVTRKTYYALSTLSKHIKEKNTGRTKAWWTEDKLYHKKNQMATFNRLVGLPKNSTKYVQLNGKFYLARGHLAAKSDFMYFAEQEATLNYNNAVPQWQTLNSSNWFKLETGIRKYAAESGLDLLIMTGPYGISTLPHEQNGLPVELYLFVEGNDRAIPVPELIWKVVYSQSTQRGVAFLAINNPYLVDIQQSIIYPDIADQLNWLSLDRTILSNG